MPSTTCTLCATARAVILRPKNRHRLCKTCFISVFEQEVHETIISNQLFQRGERIAIGASGGKDSTVLASILKTLNERHDYGLDLLLLSVDEGIKGYRDDSLETVKRNAIQYDMPLVIIGYDELYGWTMDQVVGQIGKKGNCTYCGVFRRQALDRGASKLDIKHVVTGHNADDIAETVLMNLLRGDLPRLSRATSIVTAGNSSDIKRSKPLKYAYEKEIVLYAHHKNLDYFTTECVYSPEAFRGTARALIKDLERIRPSAILDVVRSGEDMAKLAPNMATTSRPESSVDGVSNAQSDVAADQIEQHDPHSSATVKSMDQQEKRSLEALNTQDMSKTIAAESVSASQTDLKPATRANATKTAKKTAQQEARRCQRCGYLTSQALCKACVLLEALNKANPQRRVCV